MADAISVETAIEFFKKIVKNGYLYRSIDELEKFLIMARGIYTATLSDDYQRELLSMLCSPFTDEVTYGFYGMLSEQMFFVVDGKLHFIDCKDLSKIIAGLRA